jgi:hypothetical protein
LSANLACAERTADGDRGGNSDAVQVIGVPVVLKTVV